MSTGINEHTFYYTKAKFNYFVEYYYDGIKDESKTETIEATYLDEISTYTDKNIHGFKLGRTEGLPLTIGTNETENIIKVYYIIDDENTKDLSYTVEYYKDNEIVNSDTRTITETVHILNPETLDVDKDLFTDANKYNGYDLVATEPEEIPDTVENGTIIKVYYERKDTQVIVKYVDKSKGEEIDQQEIITGKVFDEYDITSRIKEIPGYTCVEVVGDITGEMTEEPITIIINYIHNARVTVNHIDREKDIVLETETKNGKVGDTVETFAKDFEGYVLVESPDEETVTMTLDDIVVNYYYVKVSEGVIEKHIDISTGTILYEELHEGNSGNSYETNAKDFEGYLLVTNKEYYEMIAKENPEFLEENEVNTVEEYMSKNNINSEEEYMPNEAEGTMEETGKEIKYYYIPKAKLIVRYIDITTGEEIVEEIDGEEVSTTIEQDGRLNQNYESQEREFEKYILATNRGYYRKYFAEHPEELAAEEVETVEEYMEKHNINPQEVYIPENAKGTCGHETVVEYYYSLEREIVVKYIDKVTGEEVGEEVIKVGPDGEPYDVTEDEKEVEGYTLIETPENPEGTYEEENEPRSYYYAKNTHVLVSYVDKISGEVIDEVSNYKIDGYEGKTYETEKKEFENYKFDEAVGNTEGTMTREPLQVIYYYTKTEPPIENTVTNEITNNTVTNEITNNTVTNEVTNNTNTTNSVTNTVTNTTPAPTRQETTIIIKDSGNTTTTNTIPKTTNTKNTTNNSIVNRIVSPKTGDIVPIIAIGIIGLVTIINIVISIIKKTRKEKESSKH